MPYIGLSLALLQFTQISRLLVFLCTAKTNVLVNSSGTFNAMSNV